MSDREGFLARWSRRKHTAGCERKSVTSQSKHANAEPQADGTGAAPQNEPVVDLAELPAIEAIDANSDITAFLAPGVPGFGSLVTEDAHRLLALLQLHPETGPTEAAVLSSRGQMPEARPVLESGASAPPEGRPDSHPGDPRTNAEIAVTKRESGKQQPPPQSKLQRHGGALPK